MLDLFYILIAIQLLLGLYGLVDGLLWRGYVLRRLRAGRAGYAPRVALICPCKGVEPELEQNLQALAAQDYPDYTLFLSMASTKDAAHAVAQAVAARAARPVQIVIAGEPADCGDKVNNLWAAVEQAGEGFEVYVFADSDGRVPRDWLARLVAPLAESKIGATTTFRWLVPARDNLASAVAAAWNAPLVSMLGEHGRNFCWGGGTAIRRATFEQVRAADYWRGAVSDDYALTRALRNHGQPIRFVPECLVPSKVAVTWDGLLEFTNRQIIITRVYAPRLWALALPAHTLYSLTVLYALVVLVAAWPLGGTMLAVGALVALVLLLGALRGLLRLLAVMEVLPDRRAELLEKSWVWTLLAPAVPFLYAWNLLVAAFRRRITWRGITYDLTSPNQTRIVSR